MSLFLTSFIFEKKEYDEEFYQLDGWIERYTQTIDGYIGMDTPFAQARFILEHDIHPGITFVSDYACRQFLDNSGLKINELSIFARALIECDENNVVTRVIVPRDITHLPVY
ncbi:hypothetical protein GFJ91_19325 [Salmonella enterica subsp. enterica serovar Enteritidis]|nr:hypothetical protein [Salmonella enterica subsp. enterica serovar Enteritidis]